MTPEQIALVQTSWQKVVPIKEKAAELFYGKLFEMDPSLKPLFKGDMAEQGRKLTTMLNTVVVKLNSLGDIVPAVQDLGRRHVKYGVKDAHYATVGGALLWTLGAGLGDAFTDEVKEAWTTAYTILSGAMKEAAAAVPA
jgi:hemoglobin-like flavoprotein